MSKEKAELQLELREIKNHQKRVAMVQPMQGPSPKKAKLEESLPTRFEVNSKLETSEAPHSLGMN